MKISFLHRTRGIGVEGAHIVGIVNALIKYGHEIRIVSSAGNSRGEVLCSDYNWDTIG